MDKFFHKMNFGFTANQLVIKLISNIDSYKGKWNAMEQKENNYLKELRKIATIESIGSSTRIEGVKLSNEEIKILLENIKIVELKTRDEQEVIGYNDVLEIIYENYENILLSKNYILQLHKNLLAHSTKDENQRGHYKNLTNKVVANYPDGKQRVIFNTTDPHLVDNEMNDLLCWANVAFESKAIHPLLIIGLFIYEFLSIHPFHDGNGRLSRLLTNLLLLKNEYYFIQYVSFENCIEQKKKTYYEVLMAGQKNRNTDNENIEEWILYFLQTVETMIYRLEEKYNVYKTKGGYLNERQTNVFEIIKLHNPIKLIDITTMLPDVSINTIKKDLQYLKQEQFIEAIGKNKGTVYFFNQAKNVK